jgi:hypothetical protein
VSIGYPRFAQAKSELFCNNYHIHSDTGGIADSNTPLVELCPSRHKRRPSGNSDRIWRPLQARLLYSTSYILCALIQNLGDNNPLQSCPKEDFTMIKHEGNRIKTKSSIIIIIKPDMRPHLTLLQADPTLNLW